MRLFLAVDLDDHTRAQIGPTRAALQALLDQARVPPRITWVKEELAHVTVRFIGEVSEDTASALQQAVSAGFDLAPFEVCWERIGTFPSGRRPRVVWVGPAATQDTLLALAREVDQRLEPIVGAGELRPFNAHLTLGRVKDPGKGVDWPRAIAAAAWHRTTTHVDRVTLYVSRLSPKGPTYTELCRGTLTG